MAGRCLGRTAGLGWGPAHSATLGGEKEAVEQHPSIGHGESGSSQPVVSLGGTPRPSACE